MIELLINSYNGRQILKNMLIKDLKARYAGSLLGPLWSILTPLYFVLLYTFVFSTILKVRFEETEGAPSFVVYFLAGLIPWLFFQESVSRSSYAFIENAHIIKKIKFPVEICVLNVLLSSMVSFVIYLILYFCYLLVIGRFSVGSLIFLPIPVLMEIFFIIGISFGIGSISVFFRDIAQVVPLLLNALFFLTPIVYPSSIIPEGIRWVFYFNPFYWITKIYRAILIDGMLLGWKDFIYPVILSIMVFYAGWTIFKKTSEAFKDIL